MVDASTPISAIVSRVRCWESSELALDFKERSRVWYSSFLSHCLLSINWDTMLFTISQLFMTLFFVVISSNRTPRSYDLEHWRRIETYHTSPRLEPRISYYIIGNSKRWSNWS
jgi:hypothetical protein